MSNFIEMRIKRTGQKISVSLMNAEPKKIKEQIKEHQKKTPYKMFYVKDLETNDILHIQVKELEFID